jgi:hypothetical protein
MHMHMHVAKQLQVFRPLQQPNTQPDGTHRHWPTVRAVLGIARKIRKLK